MFMTVKTEYYLFFSRFTAHSAFLQKLDADQNDGTLINHKTLKTLNKQNFVSTQLQAIWDNYLPTLIANS